MKHAQLLLTLLSLTHSVLSLPSSYRHTNSIGDNRSVPKVFAIATNGEQVVLSKSHASSKGYEFPRGKAKDEEAYLSRLTAERELDEETGYVGRARSRYPPGFQIYDHNRNKQEWLNAHIVDIAYQRDGQTEEQANRSTFLCDFADVGDYIERDEQKRLWKLAYPYVFHYREETPPPEGHPDPKGVKDNEWVRESSQYA